MAFAECLVATHVSALSFLFFFFLFIFGHRSNVKKMSESKKKKRQKKKQQTRRRKRQKKGNLRLIKVASKEKRERGNHSSIGPGERKDSFFQDTGRSVIAYACLYFFPFFAGKRKKPNENSFFFFSFSSPSSQWYHYKSKC